MRTAPQAAAGSRCSRRHELVGARRAARVERSPKCRPVVWGRLTTGRCSLVTTSGEPEDVCVGRLGDLSDDDLLAHTPVDPEAFGVFYERHVRLIVGFLMRATGDTERALDLTAEVFAAALVGARRFKGGGPPANAWLVGIARNKLAAARRREALAFAARRRLGMPALGFDDEEIERVEEMLAADGAGYRAAMAGLPDAERDAISARVLEGRGYPEIAAAQGTSRAATRQRVSRGLARLGRAGRGEA